MTSLSRSQVLRDFKIILKYAGSLPSGASFKRHIVEKFREGFAETDLKKVQLLRSTAHAYVQMVQSVNELKRLRYMDTGEKLDPREKIRATAARVGLCVPRFADDALPSKLS